MAENLYNASMAIRMNQDEIEKRIKNIISFFPNIKPFLLEY